MRDLRGAIRNQPPAEHPHDKDPLHMPGAIQPYGVLLVADPQTRQVQFVSANAEELLGIPAAEILDRSYLALCDSERERKAIRDAVTHDTILFPNPLQFTIKGRLFDAVMHNHRGCHVIEMEPCGAEDAPYADMSMRAVEEMIDPGSAEELYQRAVRVVREVTGFDRVMLYRFDARYNGQVLAEAAREGVGSFLGLFFPSSDIAAPARDLYLKNLTRYIPDIGAVPCGLVGVHPVSGAGGGQHAVDMSHANLRSVAPCHLNYLKNMGVRASMSFSINVDDRLWGLFACHHYAPRRVSYEQRVVCEQTAMMFIYKLGSLASATARLQRRQRGVEQLGRSLSVGAALVARIGSAQCAVDQEGQRAAAVLQERALAAIHAELGWLLPQGGATPVFQGSAGEAASGKALTEQHSLLLELVEADSAAVVRQGQVYRIGDAPPEIAIYAIASMFGRELPALTDGALPVFAADNLSVVVPVTSAIKDRAAGILAVSLSDEAPVYLIWFRREQIVQATWAGNPAADAITANADGFTPRASFAAWKEDIRNLSRPWLLEDVEIADRLGVLIRNVASPQAGIMHGAQARMEAAPATPTTATWPDAAAAPRELPHAFSGSSPALRNGQTAGPRRVIRVGQV